MMADFEKKDYVKLSSSEIFKRVFFVGDRIIAGIIFGFILTVLYLMLINVINLLIVAPWFYGVLILIGIICYSLYFIKKGEYYYQEHIFLNSSITLVYIVWICATGIVGGFFMVAYGLEYVLELTIIYILIYLIGYIIARLVFKSWKKKMGYIRIIVLVFVITMIILTPIIGSISFTLISESASIITYFFGFGILISFGLNALMLNAFYDKTGIDVLEDPPSKLIIIGLINSMIINFFFWIIMLIFYPIPGKSKKSRSKNSRNKSSYRSKSSYRKISYRRRFRYFGPPIEREVRPAGYYWMIALNDEIIKEKVPKEDIEYAKKSIIKKLFEQGVVPSAKDLQRLTHIPHILFDLALDDLLDEGKVKYNSTPTADFAIKGYRLAGDLKEKYFNKIDSNQVQQELEKKEVEFLNIIKNKQPIKSRHELWLLASNIGVRPLWKIEGLIDSLKDRKKIYYKKKSPKGWYAQ
ncbi:MAG: hypothetical protein ACTSR8_15240 [Promethearchaeota archaeon]